jgi:hypothetical protein
LVTGVEAHPGPEAAISAQNDLTWTPQMMRAERLAAAQ